MTRLLPLLFALTITPAFPQNIDVKKPVKVCTWVPMKPGDWSDCMIKESTKMVDAITWRDSTQIRGTFATCIDTVEMRITPYRLTLFSPRACKRDGSPAFEFREYRPCE